MRNDYPADSGGWIDVPGKVLLYGYREAGTESALDAIAPMSLVRITVMRIQNGLIVIQEIEIRGLRLCRERKQND
jgi:hypothetical protein